MGVPAVIHEQGSPIDPPGGVRSQPEGRGGHVLGSQRIPAGMPGGKMPQGLPGAEIHGRPQAPHQVGGHRAGPHRIDGHAPAGHFPGPSPGPASARVRGGAAVPAAARAAVTAARPAVAWHGWYSGPRQHRVVGAVRRAAGRRRTGSGNLHSARVLSPPDTVEVLGAGYARR